MLFSVTLLSTEFPHMSGMASGVAMSALLLLIYGNIPHVFVLQYVQKEVWNKGTDYINNLLR